MFEFDEIDDWRSLLKARVKAREEECHAGCDEPATVLRLFGRRVGAWCKGCWRELTEGYVPKLAPPKGCRKAPSRKALMDD